MVYSQTFSEISHGIRVEVKPLYLEEKSDPVQKKHVFVYFITIRNAGATGVQLLRRHWEINDSGGEQYEVDGEGVIGKQPYIPPGGEHSYNSFCVLKSPRGNMNGYYSMEREDGTSIKVKIPRFLLVSHVLN